MVDAGGEVRGRKVHHRRVRRNRAAANVEHARRRAFERDHLELSDRDLASMVEMIQRSEGTFLRRSSNARSVWLLDFEGRARQVVYDRNRKTIVTVLTVREEGGGGCQ